MYNVQIKNKEHHVNQLIEPDLMMYISLFLIKPLHSTHSTHSTYLFKIFFSLLILSTAFLQKASGPGKNIVTLTNSKYKKAFLKTLSTFNKVFRTKKSKN